MNKGKFSQKAYFATIKQKEAGKARLQEGDAVLLDYNHILFPTVIRKLKSTPKRFMLGFNVPFQIGTQFSSKNNYFLKFVGKSIERITFSENKDTINLTNLLPLKTIREFPIFLFNYGIYTLIWIYSKGNKIAKLPTEILLTSGGFDLLELAGAFFCEGLKARKFNRHRDRLSFSNADPAQIKWFIEASEMLLKIPKGKWSSQILYPSDNEQSKDKVLACWSAIGISKEKMTLVKNIKINNLTGVCILNIYNSSLAEAFYHLMEECQKRALASKDNAILFFRGISRGDLGVDKTDGQSVSFSTDSQENALFFTKVCNVMGIKTHRPKKDCRGHNGSWYVGITHFNNLEKLVRYNCITHQRRKEKLLRKFLITGKNHHIIYLRAINNGANTRLKLIQYLGIADSTAGAALPKYTLRGYLLRKYNSNRKLPYTYELSKKGLETLEFYNKIKKEYSSKLVEQEGS